MKIERVVTGLLDENCYVLKIDDVCLVVDPGDDYQKIKEVVGDSKVLAVLLTHSHFDHIGALRNFLTKRSVKIFKKSSVIDEGTITIGEFNFKVIFTPGHSKDSISFYFPNEQVMFVGDFVFLESIGRCDLPGGSENEMQESLGKLKEYPKETILYPGHGDSTTLDYEISHNPYLN